MTRKTSPTFRRRWLGKTLTGLRAQSGHSLKAAAETLGRNRTTVQRYETGEYPISTSQVLTLLDLYDVTGRDERSWTLKLAREAAQRGWWDGFEIENGLADYLWMEENSQKIQLLATGTIPGITQTSAFAKALIADGPDRNDQLLSDRRLEARLLRSEELHKPNAATFEVLLYEPVLRNQVGGTDVLAEQLTYLLKISRNDNIRIRVLPAKSWKHIALGIETGFTIFTLPDAWPQVLCIETPLGASYRESPEIVPFADAFDLLWTEFALAEPQSFDLVTEISKDIAE